MNADERAAVATPAMLLAEGFARHVGDWSRAQGAAEAVAHAASDAARAASLALSDGHVCVLLRDLVPLLDLPGLPGLPGLPDPSAAPVAPADSGAKTSAKTWRQALLASRVVGTPDAPGAMPLVLDAEGRLYLHRYFDYERRLAQRLLRAQATTPIAAGIADADPRSALRTRLVGLFAANATRPGATPDWQLIAVALALRGRLTIISGGPGTGKTTTVVNLLACLLGQDPGCRIALAAPTGKAAARMSEAIRERAAHLPAEIRTQLPAAASTIHRLLGATPRGFTHHAGNRLAIDALIVDEASMLDLALATRLLEAVPDDARIVLLGDKDQLAAVESGAVFAELCTDPRLSRACREDLADLCAIAPESIAPPSPIEPSIGDDAPLPGQRATPPIEERLADDTPLPEDGAMRREAEDQPASGALNTGGALPDATVWFTRNFRFDADSGIGRLAAAINAGRTDAALAILGSAPAAAHAGADPELQWLDDDAAQLSPAAIERVVSGYAPFFNALGRDLTQHREIVDAFARYRVLCAVRDGRRGVAAVNLELTRRVRERLGTLDRNPRSAWFPGRPVLVRRNDAVLKLFNGDIGIALPNADGGANGELMVHFPQPDGGLRAIAPLRLPEHETAFAITVHKAQGSEFDAVFVLLPARTSRVLTRELLYTAVTRARKHVTLCAGAAALTAAIEARTRRHSGLLARLAEAQAAESGVPFLAPKRLG